MTKRFLIENNIGAFNTLEILYSFQKENFLVSKNIERSATWETFEGFCSILQAIVIAIDFDLQLRSSVSRIVPYYIFQVYEYRDTEAVKVGTVAENHITISPMPTNSL